MMTGDQRQDTYKQAVTSRRRVLAAAALAPVLAGAGPAAARAMPDGATGALPHMRVKPVTTTESDWAAVAKELGRSGNLLRGTTYHTPSPATIFASSSSTTSSRAASSSHRRSHWARTWPSSATPTAARCAWAMWRSPRRNYRR